MIEPLALWSSRSALFAGGLVVLAPLLHRFGQIETPTFVNLAALGFVFAALGVALGIYAGGSIWIRGRAGAWQVFTGIVVGLMVWSWPLAALPRFFGLPMINDISTDTVSAPRFATLASERKFRGNGAVYSGAKAAALQVKAYPDVRTLVAERSVEEVHDIVLDLIKGRRGLGWRVVADQAPSLSPPKPGLIEAVEKTMIMGFVDDIAIRVSGNERETRVDVRSASRYGQHDFGANAARIRRFMRELTGRFDAIAPGTAPRRPVARAGAEKDEAVGDKQGDAATGRAKRPKARTGATAASARAQDPAPRETRRGRGRREPPQE